MSGIRQAYWLELGCLSPLPHNLPLFKRLGQADPHTGKGSKRETPRGKTLSNFFCGTKHVRFRTKGNRLHFLVEGSKKAHCKNMDAEKERICGHFYNLPHLSGEDGNLSGVLSLFFF